MKLTDRFNPFRADADPLSAYLADFRIEADYFTHWPQQDFKTLQNLVSTRIKLVLQTQGQAELTAGSEHFTLTPGQRDAPPRLTASTAPPPSIMWIPMKFSSICILMPVSTGFCSNSVSRAFCTFRRS